MKKITLILLIAMVPFLTIAQKRSKKNKKAKTERNDATYEFMVITGNQIMGSAPKSKSKKINSSNAKAKDMMKSNQSLRISFDFGELINEENTSLSKARYKSMSAAVNSAANYGWEFVSSNITFNKDVTQHYYYMRRNK
jgi:hypothetical protein